jgi:hypothetical protein
MRQYYYKATLKNGVSVREPKIIYRIGLIVHTNPDRSSKEACGVGIHLAKTLCAARKYVPRAEEFYLAEAGVILGEDEDKIRCASCKIIKQLTNRQLRHIEFEEKTEEEKSKMRERMRKGFTEPLCGNDWFNKHWNDITQEEIEEQRLIVKTERGEISLSPIVSKRDIRQVLATIKTQVV